MVVDEGYVADSVADPEGAVDATDGESQQYAVVEDACIGVYELIVAVHVASAVGYEDAVVRQIVCVWQMGAVYVEAERTRAGSYYRNERQVVAAHIDRQRPVAIRSEGDHRVVIFEIGGQVSEVVVERPGTGDDDG